MIWALTPVTIDVPCPQPVAPVVNYPPVMHGIPSWVVGWSIAIVILVLIGLGVLINEWLENRRVAHKQNLDAKVELAKAHKNCTTCGATYAPRLEDLEVE